MKLTIAKSNLQTESKGIRIVRRYNKNGHHPASHYSMEQCYAADGSKSQPSVNTHWSPITNFDTAAEAVEYAQREVAK